MHDETLERRTDSMDPSDRKRRRRWAMVVAWTRDDPARLGSLAWIDGSTTLGRGTALVRQRPDGDRAAGGVRSVYVSRDQLQVRVRAAGTLEVRNVGRVAMRVNGQPTDSAVVRAGDVVELDREWIWLVQQRPAALPDAPADFAFGQPDPVGWVGEGPTAWAIRHRAAKLRDLGGHVLITGPSGAGKELLAHAVHRGGPFVPVNAAAIPVGVAEAEWFGNRRDYPNPGTPARRGFAARAHGGTLLLDELGELPPALQAQLLRLLESGEVQRLGDERLQRIDVRVVGATLRDPAELRDDLRARFVHRLEVPGLGVRPEDVPLLVAHTLGPDGPRVTPRLMTALLRHRWTAHVRELRQLLAAAEARDGWLDLVASLPLEPLSAEPVRPAVDPATLNLDTLHAALEAHDGNRTRAAKALGISRHQLRRRLDKLGAR